MKISNSFSFIPSHLDKDKWMNGLGHITLITITIHIPVTTPHSGRHFYIEKVWIHLILDISYFFLCLPRMRRKIRKLLVNTYLKGYYTTTITSITQWFGWQRETSKNENSKKISYFRIWNIIMSRYFSFFFSYFFPSFIFPSVFLFSILEEILHTSIHTPPAAAAVTAAAASERYHYRIEQIPMTFWWVRYVTVRLQLTAV